MYSEWLLSVHSLYSLTISFAMMHSAEDTPRKKKETPQDKIPIRVMELLFHTNNTFSTVAGLGEETILRGKWDIIGNTRNQLWMQVWRFGFGRSVSGSVYRYVELLLLWV